MLVPQATDPDSMSQKQVVPCRVPVHHVKPCRVERIDTFLKDPGGFLAVHAGLPDGAMCKETADGSSPIEVDGRFPPIYGKHGMVGPRQWTGCGVQVPRRTRRLFRYTIVRTGRHSVPSPSWKSSRSAPSVPFLDGVGRNKNAPCGGGVLVLGMSLATHLVP